MSWRATFASLALIACSSSDETTTASSSGAGAGSSGTGGDKHYACDKRDQKSLCADFVDGTTRQAAQGSCTGTFLNGVHCSTDGAVGACATTAAGNVNAITYYQNGGTPFTADSAKADCTAAFDGSFTKP